MKLKIKNTKILLCLMLISIFNTINAQVYTENSKLIKLHGKEIKDTVIKYIIKTQQLSDTTDFIKGGYNIGLYEILNDENTKMNNFGIFQFSTFSSHSASYILLFDEDQCEILTTQNISVLLTKLIAFLRKNNVDDNQIVKYIINIIEICKKNESAIPWKMTLK